MDKQTNWDELRRIERKTDIIMEIKTKERMERKTNERMETNWNKDNRKKEENSEQRHILNWCRLIITRN